MPISASIRTDPVTIVRHELLPAPINPNAPPRAAKSRIDFQTAINHRLGDPGPPLAV